MGVKRDMIVEKVSLDVKNYYCVLGKHIGEGDSISSKVRVYVNRAIKLANPEAFVAELDINFVAVHPSTDTKNAHYKGLKKLADWANTEDVLEVV